MPIGARSRPPSNLPGAVRARLGWSSGWSPISGPPRGPGCCPLATEIWLYSWPEEGGPRLSASLRPGDPLPRPTHHRCLWRGQIQSGERERAGSSEQGVKSTLECPRKRGRSTYKRAGREKTIRPRRSWSGGVVDERRMEKRMTTKWTGGRTEPKTRDMDDAALRMRVAIPTAGGAASAAEQQHRGGGASQGCRRDWRRSAWPARSTPWTASYGLDMFIFVAGSAAWWAERANLLARNRRCPA